MLVFLESHLLSYIDVDFCPSCYSMIIMMYLPVLNKMTTYEYIVRKRDEEECKSSEKDLKQEIPTSKPIKVQ